MINHHQSSQPSPYTKVILVVCLFFFSLWLFSPSHISSAETIAQIGDFNTAWLSESTAETYSAAWGDMDGDGDLDILVGNVDQPNSVYRNDGNALFVDVTMGDVANTVDATYGVAWGDMDGDGDLDILVGNRDEPNKVYRNDGDALFVDVTTGDLATTADVTGSVAWGDMDGDGDLDILIGNFDEPNKVYRNDGNALFVDVTTGDLATLPDVTTSVAWGDMDGDGDLDILTGNFGSNMIFQNDGNGLFVEVTTGDLANAIDFTRSVAWGDMDGDGDLDILIGNVGETDNEVFGEPNKLYRNDGGGVFVNVTTGDLAATVDLTESVAWGDMDGDGDLDILVGNTGISRVYRNDGNGLFVAATTGDLATAEASTEGIAWGDMDEDGDLDILVGNAGELNKVYRNDGNGLFIDATTGVLAVTEASTATVAWGDMDGDSDLDILFGNFGEPNTLYRNDGSGLFVDVTTGNLASATDSTLSVAWGDMDGDGDLDILVGNAPEPNKVYRNDGNGLFVDVTTGDLAAEADHTLGVAWGDMDGDGDLDILVGNREEPNKLYRNDGNALFVNVTTGDLATVADFTKSVAWGDMDGDGDLDILVGNSGINKVYRNEGSGLFVDVTIGDLAVAIDDTESIAWGNMDGDGDLDILVGNRGKSNRVYRNDGNGSFSNATSGDMLFDTDDTESVAWGDMDNDGDLDILAGNHGRPNKVYRNEGNSLFVDVTTGDLAAVADFTESVAWGDMDGDGDLDILAGNNFLQPSKVYRNLQHNNAAPAIAAIGHPTISAAPPAGIAEVHHFGVGNIITNQLISIPFQLDHPNSIVASSLQVAYSLTGGGEWKPAIGVVNPPVGLLATDGTTYFFQWDTFASGFFGQSDNVVLRFTVQAQSNSGTTGTFAYPNLSAGSILSAVSSTATTPFRVRGTQVRVFEEMIAEGAAVSDAIVHRLPAGGAQSTMVSDASGQPLVTDGLGYLRGQGVIGLGDQLVALSPITRTDKFTLYYTNAVPTTMGVDGFTVTGAGVQEVVILAENPLILFNIDLALEWDARNDPEFSENLNNALQSTSQLLFDASNGTMALGDVRVTMNKENWLGADVVMLASSGVRPVANIGGIVGQSTPDIGVTGVLTDAFAPGQVRIGPNWDPFGNSFVDLGVDWQRALAHELSHYLLFLPDNYIGVVDGNLVYVDCFGSLMTNTYDEGYSEFLRRNEWTGDCLNTVAQKETGRTDWETITRFYPELAGKRGAMQLNSGPATLPLAVTNVQVVEPTEAVNTLPPRNFDLRKAEGNQALISVPRAEGYLHKTNGTPNDETDDTIIQLGKTSGGGDRIYVRGAEIGDRVCVRDATSGRSGCVTVTAISVSVSLALQPNWRPDIESQPVTSRTLNITVTVPVAVPTMRVQVVPAYGSQENPDNITAVATTMSSSDGGLTWEQTITLAYPVFEGTIRVVVQNASPEQEAVAQYTINSTFWGGNQRAWGGNQRAWGGNQRAWGGNQRAWGAPLTSGDGQINIFNADDPFGVNGISSLQAVPTLAQLPSWLTPVGNGYRVLQEGTYETQNDNRVITFNYLQSQVPPGYEFALNVYVKNAGQPWTRLETVLDDGQNLATARLLEPADGTYALLATVDIAPFDTGWNHFGYPIPETRPVAEVLSSIDGSYTLIANLDGNVWRTYDPNVSRDYPQFAPTVNDLTELGYTKAYWINVTEPVQLFVGVPRRGSHAAITAPSLPPAVYFGFVTTTGATVGQTVEGVIDGVVCGSGTLFALAEQVAYRLNVSAETLYGTPNNCGTDGAPIAFRINGTPLPTTAAWENSAAHYLDLDSSVPTAIGLQQTTTDRTTGLLTLTLVAITMTLLSVHAIRKRLIYATNLDN